MSDQSNIFFYRITRIFPRWRSFKKASQFVEGCEKIQELSKVALFRGCVASDIIRHMPIDHVRASSLIFNLKRVSNSEILEFIEAQKARVRTAKESREEIVEEYNQLYQLVVVATYHPSLTELREKTDKVIEQIKENDELDFEWTWDWEDEDSHPFLESEDHPSLEPLE